MNKNFEKLKSEIKKLYPSKSISDAELNEMVENMIKFFAVAALAMHEQEKEGNT